MHGHDLILSLILSVLEHSRWRQDPDADQAGVGPTEERVQVHAGKYGDAVFG